MQIDPRLDEIDDCLYRVSVRALIIQNQKVLLVQEIPQMWWAVPGGGVDHGETIESTLYRELEEELGMPVGKATSDFQIAYYNIGGVVDAIPRMNLFFKVSLPEELIKKSTHVAKWAWFDKDEFLESNLISMYNKAELAGVIFND